MKCEYIGYKYVFYESQTEPKTMILEKRAVYVKKCSAKKKEKLQNTLHEQNSFALVMMNLTMQQEKYNGWKVKEIGGRK